ncbi:hypothetical protein C5C18_03815 [Rathayibacter tritici]|uniref:hypothetical protein n=1 Tax=Rathayibacter tritici TaxID=33888 RepID=UPI000CE80F2F|nr:hypothetical protein [Rathayibacter tritici]PPF31726.1 hypothetical protein C5C06_00485 [Rathayibacter tritici]PPF70241.1 hypothetical protein C5C21_01365 [Rathayibacter tritici]PPG08524.1 hypothetical protein C5C18_03815 [Rathayibacter tritici]PPI13071.1 hypothetical protein C5D07_11195 [Rathayibacter tritici]
MSVPISTADHASEFSISHESFQSERLARRLALLETSIAESERALRDKTDPRSGEPLPGACKGHCAQLISNLATERVLAEHIRAMIAARN